MSNLAIRFLPETLRSLAAASISGTYMGIGSGFIHPIRLMVLINDTDALLTYSWDGIDDHLVLPSHDQIVFDVTSNKSQVGGVLSFAAGTRIYVKGAPSTGSTYLSAFYGAGG